MRLNGENLKNSEETVEGAPAIWKYGFLAFTYSEIRLKVTE